MLSIVIKTLFLKESFLITIGNPGLLLIFSFFDSKIPCSTCASLINCANSDSAWIIES